MARTTYQHDRITAFEIDGRPVSIASAELARISTLDNDDELITLEWEVAGKSQEEIPDGVHGFAMTINGRTITQRGVFRESHADGWWVFKIVGLDPLKPFE
jgi:hypothetical protein